VHEGHDDHHAGSQRTAVLVTVPWPLAQGPFWRETLAPFGDRLVAIVSMDDLREHAGVHVSPLSSWERMTGEVVAALRIAPALAPLAVCGHVIIAFDSHNALWYRPARGAEPERALLHYEPNTRESGLDPTRAHSVAGLTTALATYLSHALEGNTHATNLKQSTALSAWSGLAEAISLSLGPRPGSQARSLGLSSAQGGSATSRRSGR
jgi:hypothetical protein